MWSPLIHMLIHCKAKVLILVPFYVQESWYVQSRVATLRKAMVSLRISTWNIRSLCQDRVQLNRLLLEGKVRWHPSPFGWESSGANQFDLDWKASRALEDNSMWSCYLFRMGIWSGSVLFARCQVTRRSRIEVQFAYRAGMRILDNNSLQSP